MILKLKVILRKLLGKKPDTVNHMLYSLSRSILSVGTLIKDTNVIGYQPIFPIKVRACIGSKTIKLNILIRILTTRSEIDQSYWDINE